MFITFSLKFNLKPLGLLQSTKNNTNFQFHCESTWIWRFDWCQWPLMIVCLSALCKLQCAMCMKYGIMNDYFYPKSMQMLYNNAKLLSIWIFRLFEGKKYCYESNNHQLMSFNRFFIVYFWLMTLVIFIGMLTTFYLIIWKIWI